MREFQKVIRSLSQISGASQKEVIKAETKAILQKVASGTKAAQLKKIRQRHLPIWAKDGGREWYRLNGKNYYLRNRLPDEVYETIDKRAKERVKEVRQARGFAKSLWYYIGRGLRINVKVPAYVMKSKTKISATQVARGYETVSNKEYSVTINNNSLLVGRLKLGAVMNRALMGRIKYFHMNLKKGVFKDIRQRASRYKGIEFR